MLHIKIKKFNIFIQKYSVAKVSTDSLVKSAIRQWFNKFAYTLKLCKFFTVKFSHFCNLTRSNL